MSSPKGEAAPDRSNANSLTGSLPSGTMRARLGMTGRLSAAAAVRAASSSDSTCLGADAMLAPPVRCRGRDPVCHRPEAAGPLASAGSVFGDDHRTCRPGARAARRRTGRAGAAASGPGGTGTGRPGGARGPGPGAGLGGPGTRSAGPVHAGDPRCGAAGPGRGRHELRVVPAVDEVGSPYPAGLGRPASHLDPAAAALCADPAGLRRTVLAAPPPARAVLDRLAAGPPVGSTTAGATGDPDNPVGWLVANDLLVPVSDTTVELPREVGMLLRRAVGPLGQLQPAPPVPDAPVRGAESVDSAGAGQVMEAVRHAEAVLEVLSAEPAPALKSGGLGVRDLRRLARATGMPDRRSLS